MMRSAPATPIKSIRFFFTCSSPFLRHREHSHRARPNAGAGTTWVVRDAQDVGGEAAPQYSTSMPESAAVNWLKTAWFIINLAMLPDTFNLPVMNAICVLSSPFEIPTNVS